MNLIVKPTARCNFKCTFCSSTKLSEDDNAQVELSEIRKFLIRFPETSTIIVNGGDPLMMKPDYYWKIIEMLDELGMEETCISFTSNLWAFYKKPEMWVDLFRHPRMGIATSFQYGNSRLKGDLTPYTEEEFWKISDLMLELVGYRPTFISVITPENVDTVMQTVQLAKAMGVECKINNAVASGEPVQLKNGLTMGHKDKLFILADIYEQYVQIHEAGLGEWEYNTKQMAGKLRGKQTTCPIARDCDAGIRNIQPDGRYYSCGSFGDDDLYRIDFDKEMAGDFERPLQNLELHSLKDSCYSCPMFDYCNGCRKTIHDLKHLGLVETHCKKMKELAPRIIAANNMTGQIEPTPYVQEHFKERKVIPIALG